MDIVLQASHKEYILLVSKIPTFRFQTKELRLCLSAWAIITSLAKEVMFLVALVCLSVCLWTTLLKKL